MKSDSLSRTYQIAQSFAIVLAPAPMLFLESQDTLSNAKCILLLVVTWGLSFSITYLNTFLRHTQPGFVFSLQDRNSTHWLAILVTTGALAILISRLPAEYRVHPLAFWGYLMGFALFQLTLKGSLWFWAMLFLITFLGYGNAADISVWMIPLHIFFLTLMLLTDPFSTKIQTIKEAGLRWRLGISAVCMLLATCMIPIGFLLTVPTRNKMQARPLPDTDISWADKFVTVIIMVVILVVSIWILRIFRLNWKKKTEGDLALSDVEFGKVVDLKHTAETPLSMKTPRDRVIFYYHQLMTELRSFGLLCRSWYTPNEYGNYLQTKGNLQEKAVTAILYHFYRAMYSEVEIVQEEAESARKAVHYLLTEAKHIKEGQNQKKQ